jgi:predicted Zn-dependent protease
LNTDVNLTKRVRAIANRLIPQTTAFRPDARDWKWEINVQKTDELNAYCMPGGKIMVYTGIIEQLQLSDAEIAAIVGHEIAHALREHTRERVSRAYAQQVGLSALAVLTGAGEGAMQLASTVTQVTFGLPHSREQETESDRIGLELMARAGYDPNAAISLWQKMSQKAGSSGPAFLSTHPASSSRISDLQSDLPKVLPLYQAAAKP